MIFEVTWTDPRPGDTYIRRDLGFGDDPKAGLFNVAEVARVGRFWTPVSPLDRSPIEWSLTCSDEWIRVPTFGYHTNAAEPPYVVGLAFQLGLLALASLLERVRLSDVTAARLIIGRDIHNAESGFRFYLGATFELKER